MKTTRHSYLPMLMMTAVGLSSACDEASTSTSTIPSCHATCTVAADCAGVNPLIPNEDNWTCIEGACEYKGCNSTQECIEDHGSPDLVCAPSAIFPYHECTPACTTAADCSNGSPSTDEDNWGCSEGKCEYKGCNSAQECIDAFQGSNWTCAPASPLPFDTCVRTCKAAADCQPAPASIVDEDNWACTEGWCEYKGCNSTQECTSVFGTPDWVCK